MKNKKRINKLALYLLGFYIIAIPVVQATTKFTSRSAFTHYEKTLNVLKRFVYHSRILYSKQYYSSFFYASPRGGATFIVHYMRKKSYQGRNHFKYKFQVPKFRYWYILGAHIVETSESLMDESPHLNREDIENIHDEDRSSSNSSPSSSSSSSSNSNSNSNSSNFWYNALLCFCWWLS